MAGWVHGLMKEKRWRWKATLCVMTASRSQCGFGCLHSHTPSFAHTPIMLVTHRRISKAMLAGLWSDHGGDAEGLNLIAMALGLPVKEVRGSAMCRCDRVFVCLCESCFCCRLQVQGGEIRCL